MVYSICIAMHGFLNFGCDRIAQKTNQLYISHYHIRINLIRSIFFYGCPMVFQHSFPTVFLGFPTMVNGDPVIFLNVCDNPSAGAGVPVVVQYPDGYEARRRCEISGGSIPLEHHKCGIEFWLVVWNMCFFPYTLWLFNISHGKWPIYRWFT